MTEVSVKAFKDYIRYVITSEGRFPFLKIDRLCLLNSAQGPFRVIDGKGRDVIDVENVLSLYVSESSGKIGVVMVNL